MVHDIQRASRNLCHRQLSWFRDEPLFTWLDADRVPKQITADVLAQLRGSAPTGACLSRGILRLGCVITSSIQLLYGDMQAASAPAMGG